MEPWFYETRFLWPGFARQPMLEILRRLSSAPSLRASSPAAGAPLEEIATDVFVVGGGPTGIAAAAAAARRTSVVLATRARPGGSLPLDASTRERVDSDLEEIQRSEARVLSPSVCIGFYGEEDRFVVMSESGPIAIRASRVVIATGGYDRPLLLRGADLPGVIGVRGFQLLASQGSFRHRTVGVVGAPDEVSRAMRTASLFGIELQWVVAPGSPPQGAFPRYEEGLVREILGRRRARGILLEDGRSLLSDVVVVATTQPTYELQLHLGGLPRFEGTPPVIRVDDPTSIPSLVVGEAAGWASAENAGARAAAATAAWLEGDHPATAEASPEARLATPPADDAVVCVCEDVRMRDIDRCLAEGFDDAELVKRRSGAATGACQGKLCLPLIAEAFAVRGLPPALTNVRPPIRPVRIASLGGATT